MNQFFKVFSFFSFFSFLFTNCVHDFMCHGFCPEILYLVPKHTFKKYTMVRIRHLEDSTLLIVSRAIHGAFGADI